MAKNPRKDIIKRYYEHHDTIQSNKLSEIVSELWLAEGDTSKAKLWERARTALARMGVDPKRVADIIDRRDLEALAILVAEVDAGAADKVEQPEPQAFQPNKSPGAAPSIADGRTIAQMRAEQAASTGRDSLDEPNLKRALKAFRKKIKSMRLDDESRLGNRYTTSGRSSAISAITPPKEYPEEVWRKLVELGRLKPAGKGTYELP